MQRAQRVLLLSIGLATSMGCSTTVCRCAPLGDAGLDTAVPRDAEQDAALLDAATADAPRTDAGLTCDPGRIDFVPPTGSLTEGNLCDDVFACLASPSDVAALQAVAPHFECITTPEGPCAAVTCRFHTSTLDAAEIAEVCTATTLAFVDEMACFVYL